MESLSDDSSATETVVEKKHQFLSQLVQESQSPTLEKVLRKEFSEFKEDSELHYSNRNPQDVIKVDVPLLIRLLEYSREDAKTDMDLHNVAEKLIQLSADGTTLSMKDYNNIIGHAVESNQLDELGANNNIASGTPTPADLQKANQEKQNLQKNLTQLKAAGVDIDPNKVSQTLTKTDAGQQLTSLDNENLAKMAPEIKNIVSNPQLAGQFKSLIQKAQQGK